MSPTASFFGEQPHRSTCSSQATRIFSTSKTSRNLGWALSFWLRPIIALKPSQQWHRPCSKPWLASARVKSSVLPSNMALEQTARRSAPVQKLLTGGTCVVAWVERRREPPGRVRGSQAAGSSMPVR